MNALEAGRLEPVSEPRPGHGDALRVSDLRVSFQTRSGSVDALRGVSFEVAPGERLGLVGESGSGKSVACLAILGLLDRNARISGGRVELGGVELLGPGRPARVSSKLAMIFQYPRTALNPIRRIGDQLVDVLATRARAPRKVLRSRAIELLAEVQLPKPAERMRAYPFELSGGQCQRVLIAMALAKEPLLLLADEPTTGLDVVTQRAILELLGRARLRHGMGTILVTHDLALACEFCDRIVVMKRGEVVEQGGTQQLFRSPEHRYTRGLLAATPALAGTLSDLDHPEAEEP